MARTLGRLMWWPPASLSCWWLPRVFRGTDEYCNPSVGVILPPLGAFILFWRPGPLRTEPCDECAEFDTTEDEVDRMMAAGEPAELERP